MNKKYLYILGLIIFTAVFSSCSGNKGPAGPAGSSLAVMSFQDGVYPSAAYDGTSDSYVVSGTEADINYGVSDYLYSGFFSSSSGRERTVIKFDLSALVSQPVTVKSANLILYVSHKSSTADFTVSAYKVTNNWVEEEATWNDRAAGVSWTAAGGEYNPAAVSDSVIMDSVNVYKTFRLDADMVQDWIKNPADNYGVVIISNIENDGFNNWYGFISKNYSVLTSVRPRLTVYYEVE
jgi:hypothetical protein